MTFEDSPQPGSAARSLGVSSGEFRAVQRDTPTFEAVPALVAAPGAEAPTTPQPNLHYVFDDPNDGEPGRDRMLVHGLWELSLCVGLVAAGWALVSTRGGALSGDSLRNLLLWAAVTGLLGIASAVGLRAGVPNLAVGGSAVFAGLYVLDSSDGSWGADAAVALGICAAIGLVQGAVVIGLHVPAWAASLGVALALGGWAAARAATSEVAVSSYDPLPDAYLWFGAVMAGSVVASLVGTHPGIRRGFGRYRPVADPARRRSRTAAVIVLSATVASSVLAGLAGVLAVLIFPLPATGAATTQTIVVATLLGLGAALLGGTSAYGRRGGIFGTALAACLLTVALDWTAEAHPRWPYGFVLAAAIGLGLVATRLVERYGRPTLLPANDDDTWMPRVHGLTPSGAPWGPGPTPAGGLWSDEGWGRR